MRCYCLRDQGRRRRIPSESNSRIAVVDGPGIEWPSPPLPGDTPDKIHPTTGDLLARQRWAPWTRGCTPLDSGAETSQLASSGAMLPNFKVFQPQPAVSIVAGESHFLYGIERPGTGDSAETIDEESVNQAEFLPRSMAGVQLRSARPGSRAGRSRSRSRSPRWRQTSSGDSRAGLRVLVDCTRSDVLGRPTLVGASARRWLHATSARIDHYACGSAR
jgi:hypothetical protein